MPRYLLQATYTAEGLQGLLREGGTGRVKAVESALTSLGGQLRTLDFAFGDTDVFVTCELPDDEAAAAASLRITASGMVSVRTVKLLTPEQIDAALDRELAYRGPGE